MNTTNLSLEHFNFNLPQDRIALYPPKQREDARLLVSTSEKTLIDTCFTDLHRFLQPKDLLVFNHSKVVKAALMATKPSGGKIKLLITEFLGTQAKAWFKASHAPQVGSLLKLASPKPDGKCSYLRVLERDNQSLCLASEEGTSVLSITESYGAMPIPPYMKREAETLDEQRYQTVYAQVPGSVAAPTAGLHFDENQLERLQALGIPMAEVCLHVGLGTFTPIQTENIFDHAMHSEYIVVPQRTVDAVKACKERGGRVIAVGTTALRALESASRSSRLEAFTGKTDLFITPGYQFKTVDGLLTNFHLPKSTLLVLVATFLGLQQQKRLYAHALDAGYRFLSYGDASLLLRPESELMETSSDPSSLGTKIRD